MKLINKTILNYLFIAVPVLLVLGVISYFMIKHELRDGIDENLEREKLNVQKLIESLKTPENTNLSYDSLSFIKVIGPGQTINDIYKDTSIFYKKKKEYRNYRSLKSSYQFNGTNYQITLTRTTREEEELMSDLFSVFALVILLIVVSFFVGSWLLSKKLWNPFYKTLLVLRNYDVKNHTATHFQAEKITEFDQLNAELNKMTEKIQRDFLQQKEFTENASHEMQTPLAVIRANTYLLLQSPQMREPEMILLAGIENTIRKLTALNKSLILLAKIENNQYDEKMPVNIKEKVAASLDVFSELGEAKNISISTKYSGEPIVNMNPVLADILINNLIQNAIRHNQEGGQIRISLDALSLSISNSGTPLTISEQELFVRFKKNDGSKDSLGLGLSIVKSITTLYGMEIRYFYSEGFHSFILYFPTTAHSS
jgi:signal transduction histidine kinase